MFISSIRPIRKWKFIQSSVPQLLSDGIRVTFNFFSLPFWLQVNYSSLILTPPPKLSIAAWRAIPLCCFMLFSTQADKFSKSFSVQLKSNLLFETLPDPQHTLLWWNLEALIVCSSNSSHCMYFLNLCLSKLQVERQWRDQPECNPCVPEMKELGVSPPGILPSSILHTVARGMLLNCKCNYTTDLLKTFQWLPVIYKIRSKGLIRTYKVLPDLTVVHNVTVSLAFTSHTPLCSVLHVSHDELLAISKCPVTFLTLRLCICTVNSEDTIAEDFHSNWHIEQRQLQHHVTASWKGGRVVQQLNNGINDPVLFFISLLCRPQKIWFALRLAPFTITR